MDTLIEILYKETTSLKKQYLEKTAEWAKNYYAICQQRTKWNEEQWAKYLGVKTSIANPGSSMAFVSFYNGFYNSKEYVRYRRLRDEARAISRISQSEYVKKEKNGAERHYTSSIFKLAIRITKKGLNESKIKATTSHIGVNINTTLTDGEKTVRAFTIIAEGPIQCPHYRYLIK